MPRKTRPLDRDSGRERDATLIVIASEDRYAAKVYFDRFRTKRVQFRVLPTEDCRSSPADVLARLKVFQQEFDLTDDDQLWICCDLDHWADPGHRKNLSKVLSDCHTQGFKVGLSNPCFELWLLLHFEECPPNTGKCDDITQRLHSCAGGYSKNKGCKAAMTAEMVKTAILRAEALDQGTETIPTRPTTRVYKLLKELQAREAIQL